MSVVEQFKILYSITNYLYKDFPSLDSDFDKAKSSPRVPKTLELWSSINHNAKDIGQVKFDSKNILLNLLRNNNKNKMSTQSLIDINLIMIM